MFQSRNRATGSSDLLLIRDWIATGEVSIPQSGYRLFRRMKKAIPTSICLDVSIPQSGYRLFRRELAIIETSHAIKFQSRNRATGSSDNAIATCKRNKIAVSIPQSGYRLFRPYLPVA